MRRRLSKRFAVEVVDEAITMLRDRGHLDDLAFAGFWRESRERNRPKGAAALRWELLQRGVPREVVEQALDGLDEDGGAYRVASRLADKGSRTDLGTLERRLNAHLRRRGFGASAVRGAVERVLQELSDPDYRDVEG